MSVTNCIVKISFSVLDKIKNRLRSSLSQEMLDALGIFSIENDITEINFDKVIDTFAKICI